MPNYDAHVLSGVVTYPLAVLAAFLLKIHLGVPFELTNTAMLLGYALYILGADLPDLDHPDSLIHRGTKPIVSVIVGGATYMNAVKYIDLGDSWKTVSAAWAVGVLGALAGWIGFTALMPRHRGVVHSLLFAAIYGFLAFLAGGYGLGMGFGESLFLGFAAFSGYTLHLLLDGSLKLA